MTPTETLARLLEESGAQIVLPNETVREAFAALEAENARLTQERDTYYAQTLVDAGHEATIARLTQERDAAVARAAEFENIEDFPAELQVKCGTFTPESLQHHDFISISKTLYAELQADRERLDYIFAQNCCFTDEGKRLMDREDVDAARKAGA